MSDAIFSFGTLQLPAVQEELFGRRPTMQPDALGGHRIGTLTVVDPEVIRMSGTDTHPALEATRSPDDVVRGVVLEVTPEELRRVDEYESVSYRRDSAVLASGRRAWIYLPRSAVTEPGD